MEMERAFDVPDGHERQRLHLLGCTRLLDSEASAAFDRITRMAAEMFDTPISLVSLVDQHRQWFKSRYGLDVAQTERESSFCAHAIKSARVMVVEDAALDERFASNRLVLGAPRIRFYAGAPLMLESGHALGSLCVLDTQPRRFSASQRAMLAEMARLVMAQIDLHQRAGRINEVTRLPNRAQLAEDLQTMMERFPGEERALMLIDAMGDRQFHDSARAVGMGAMEGALVEVAAKLRRLLREGSALYHVGETRFAFLLPDSPTRPRESFASALLEAMRQPLDMGGVAMELEVQAGLVRFTLEGQGPGDALRKAMSALHESSALGRSHAWHGASFDDSHRRAHRLLRDVSAGLLRGEFRLVYQPKLDLVAGRYSGVEALARWRHPELGDVSPAEFIPLVESTTVIHDFTQWAIHTALAQLAAWSGEGVDLTVAVNVSSRNLEHPAFARGVREACGLHGVEANRLHVECTENAIMTGAATHASLDALRAMGAQISLDDFGMGYSNLACLSALPVELLKLDQSLIKPIAADPRALVMFQSLIRLGHSLGYRMLAEGVESQEMLDLVVAAKCDAAQGYHLSRPLEASAIVGFLRLAVSTGGQGENAPESP